MTWVQLHPVSQRKRCLTFCVQVSRRTSVLNKYHLRFIFGRKTSTLNRWHKVPACKDCHKTYHRKMADRYFNQLTGSDWPVDSLMIAMLSAVFIIVLLQFAVTILSRVRYWHNTRGRTHGLRAHYDHPNHQKPVELLIYSEPPQHNDLADIAGSSHSGAIFDDADYRLGGYRNTGPLHARSKYARRRRYHEPGYAQVLNTGEET